MQLDALITGLGLAPASGDAGIAVPDIADDSRRVTPGSLFIARTGATGDGSAFLDDAIARGAAAIILPHYAPALPPEAKATEAGAGKGLCIVRAAEAVAVDHALTATLAERFFGEPSRRLRLLGITGTNGKTTVAYITRHLLGAAGVKCGLIGTIELDDGATRQPAELTTPGPIDTARLLARMVANGCGAAVMEVSSHALHQGRVAAMRFHAGVFTNLTGDHLDYHKTMEDYAAAKARLFAMLPSAKTAASDGTRAGWAVLNADDPYAVTMYGDGHSRAIWTTLNPKLIAEAEQQSDTPPARSFAYAKVLAMRADGSRVTMTGPWGSLELDLPLIGRHNVSNVLQAAALAASVTGVSRTLRTALETCPQAPGRLERVIIPHQSSSGAAHKAPQVLVDYAHTHDALENVLTALRPLTPGRLIALVGCGGDRDTNKRPKMAKVACRLADRVWITSDNPRTEDPHTIIAQMLDGVPNQDNGRVTVEPDRAAAIARCIADAEPGDTVLLAGKGHEDYQIIADPQNPGRTIKTHFDDREHAAEALQQWRTA